VARGAILILAFSVVDRDRIGTCALVGQRTHVERCFPVKAVALLPDTVRSGKRTWI
jgi:hypothetical protein